MKKFNCSHQAPTMAQSKYGTPDRQTIKAFQVLLAAAFFPAAAAIAFAAFAVLLIHQSKCARGAAIDSEATTAPASLD